MRSRISRRTFVKSTAGMAAGALAGGLGFNILRHRPKKNIILLVCDALRGDVPGLTRHADGSPVRIMPGLGDFAKRGVSHEMAIAPSSWTPISMGSILYDVPPMNVSYAGGLTVRGGSNITEALARRGYGTFSVNANWVLDVPEIRQGFGEFRVLKKTAIEGERPVEVSAYAVNDAALSLVRQLRESDSYFLYLHYMDTHEPYFCPDAALARLGARFMPVAYTSRVGGKFMAGEEFLSREVTLAEGMEQLRKHYDAAALFLDRAFGSLLRRFEDEGLLEDTLVIVTSDHGEEFGDNVETKPTFGHNQNLSHQQIHSPLVIVDTSGKSPAGEQSLEPVCLRRTVNNAVRGFLGEETESTPRPIVSYLNFPGTNAFSYIDGRLKATGEFGGGGEVGALSFYSMAGRSTQWQRIEPAEVSPKLVEKVLGTVSGSGQDALEMQDFSPEQLERLRNLGYLN